MFLTPDEVRELTGRARAQAQISALKRMRIRHRVNEIGRPVVTWAAVDSWYGRPDDTEAAAPDFEALRA